MVRRYVGGYLRFFIAVVKTMTIGNLGRKGFIPV